MRFASLASGSRGNALLVESEDTLIMIDCGLTLATLEERFKAVDRDPNDLAAVLVTHEHGDHAHGAAAFTRRYGTPIFATPGTSNRIEGLAKHRHLNCHRPLTIGSIVIEPFPVPHDAREPCQFVFHAEGRRLAVLTDTGHITPTIVERLKGCDAMAVEFNHDLKMLEEGPYPPALKTRVGSKYGHLNNMQSAELVAGVQHAGLQWVAGLHLSERNNTPQHVRDAAACVGDGRTWELYLATQDVVMEWLEVE